MFIPRTAKNLNFYDIQLLLKDLTKDDIEQIKKYSKNLRQ